MSVNLPANFDRGRDRVVFKTSWVPGDRSGERCGRPEGVLDLRRCVKRTSWAQRAWLEGRLGFQGTCQESVWGPKWPAGRASWAPGGLPGGRLGPQRPAGRASWAPEACQQGLQGRKVADPSNCQRFQGSAQAVLCPRPPRIHSRPTEICL